MMQTSGKLWWYNFYHSMIDFESYPTRIAKVVLFSHTTQKHIAITTTRLSLLMLLKHHYLPLGCGHEPVKGVLL
jgi:hypothetical protein